MYKRNVRLVFSIAVISLAFLGLALAGCAGSPRAGAAAVPAGFSTYYVKADGSDSNDGLSEAAPFRSLRKAVDVVNTGKIKTVTVLGVLNPGSEGRNSRHPDSVFNITDTRGAEITIRGKEGADEAEQGVLSGAGAGKTVIAVMEKSRVRLEHLRIEGGSSEYLGAGINVRDQARLTLGEGTLVWNNHSRMGGGGVGIVGGTFTMENGEISGNTAQGGGGGVGMVGGTFTMEGGGISGNAAQIGSGVMVIEDGSFTMRGGEISGNSAKYGGGVLVADRGTFIMEGGEISGNTTQDGGGGVAVRGGDFIMVDGEISGNESAEFGGGVSIVDGTFTLRGGEISGNESVIGGGGVSIVDGTFTMENGEISGNTAQGGGGGVVIGGGSFILRGGEISGNKSQVIGGGVVVSGTFTMMDGVISANETSTSGGGVSIDASAGGKFIKTGGTIDAANSAGTGNVVYIHDANGYRKRDTAAGPGVNLDSGKSGGAGGWE